MGVIHVLGCLLLIGVLSWVIIYLSGDKMDPDVRGLIKKAAVVLCVAVLLFWVLGLCGVIDVNVNRLFWGPPAR